MLLGDVIFTIMKSTFLCQSLDILQRERELERELDRSIIDFK